MYTHNILYEIVFLSIIIIYSEKERERADLADIYDRQRLKNFNSVARDANHCRTRYNTYVVKAASCIFHCHFRAIIYCPHEIIIVYELDDLPGALHGIFRRFGINLLSI